tara:strand:+ start:655 stop:978 length:324 start_codon:yes stop_codon:yes gene_type:complete
MIKATKKWLAIKISSGLLVPLMVWFIISFVSLVDANSSQTQVFFSNFFIKIIMFLFLIVAFTFYTLTISEVFEDYIGNLKLKNAANRLLVLFSIIITLTLLIFLFKI